MGKGGGCVPSKKESTRPKKTARGTSAADGSDETALVSAGNDPVSAPPLPEKAGVRIVIVFYSMYGHVETLAKRMKLGADSVKGVEAVLYRVPETLPDDVLVQMKAPPKDATIPVIESLDELVGADGLLFGFPTRFGSMAAQMKSFFDSLGGLWMEQKLAGKPAGFFVSTGTQGGGQETTAWTAITQLAHHGMLYVPIGYKFGPRMMTRTDAVRGGSPYGAGVFVGDGTREPSETELGLAKLHGRYMAFIVHRLASSRLI